ncbi:MAG: hypothetical protein J0L92_21840 [Deltaproteobacteria bacterium]|nr:hypothetical protein [Deltaproteobacteria bacterium]
MIELVHMTGFLAAHAIWSVSSGETLIPMLGRERTGGQRDLVRFATPELGEGVARAKQTLDAPEPGVARSVVVYDGRITLPTGKIDAVICEGRDHAGGASLVVAVPYRHASSANGFAVHRPKFLEATDASPATLDAFFVGVDSHSAAAPVWTRHLDQSL